ncbi:hypothetical protein [Frigoribacterium sp. VKM Ac-2530]|uniref:hypothetical protein n=1 Tax=Frigoribacterium sp. VKM Ac-2530 TaxID=2783822 RepID=UPI001889EBC3|nr:hypothetical protein [Frigoribacterium sp. VKM Ac-2530]MBF4580991.1 hypothetical protein [Frigoribacterium sp. VKM Ac-2530]
MKKTLTRAGAIGLAAATILTGLSFGPAAASAAPAAATASPSAATTSVTYAPFVVTVPGGFAAQNSARDMSVRQYPTLEAARAASVLVSVPTNQWGPMRIKDTNSCISLSGATSFDWVKTVSCGAGDRQQFKFDGKGVLRNKSVPATWSLAGYSTSNKMFTFSAGAPLQMNDDFSTFQAHVSEISISDRTAVLSGSARPGSHIWVDGVDVATANADDGTWSHTLLGLALGTQTAVVDQYEDGTKTGTRDVEVDLAVSPVTADVAFGSDPATPATIRGTAQAGAAIDILDASGKSVKAASADAMTGEWSTTLPSPNVGGMQTYTVQQVIGGEPNGPVTITADFGAAVSIVTPADGSEHEGAVRFQGRGVDGGQVELHEDGEPDAVGAATVTGGVWTISDVAVSDKRATYTATQTGKGNNVTTSTVTLNPEAEGATPVVVTNPADPAAGYTPNTAFTFEGTGTTGKTTTVENKWGTRLATTPVTDGTWSWTRADMGTTTWQLRFVQDKGQPAESVAEVMNFKPNAAPAPLVVVTNPAKATDGYTPNTSFTFRGTATAGKTITVENKWGTRIATTPASDGTWSWTRADMGTTTWQLHFVQDKGLPAEFTAKVLDFKPNAVVPAPLVVVTNPADPADGYTPNAAFTFEGTATAGKTITVENIFGTRIATVPVDEDESWNWTRANMGTSTIWQLRFVQDKDQPGEAVAEVLNFGPTR